MKAFQKYRWTQKKVYISVWTLFEAPSVQATLHMDQSYAKNLDIFKNSEFESCESLFNITNMIIGEISEIKNVSYIDAASR